MTEQVTRIIRRATCIDVMFPCAKAPVTVTGGRLLWGSEVSWIFVKVSDSEAYWIHTKTDFVVPSARNY